jgi:hypothetical protein
MFKKNGTTFFIRILILAAVGANYMRFFGCIAVFAQNYRNFWSFQRCPAFAGSAG